MRGKLKPGFKMVRATSRHPMFYPQWLERTLEREMGTYPDGARECRLCACTDYSACDTPGGCYWAEQFLCSSCVHLMASWPLLRLANGYGMAASWAFEPPGQRCDCCPRGDEYNGFGSGPLSFRCPKSCSCHD